MATDNTPQYKYGTDGSVIRLVDNVQIFEDAKDTAWHEYMHYVSNGGTVNPADEILQTPFISKYKILQAVHKAGIDPEGIPYVNKLFTVLNSDVMLREAWIAASTIYVKDEQVRSLLQYVGLDPVTILGV